MDAKTVEQSKVTIGNLMQPEHANPSGNVHGGDQPMHIGTLVTCTGYLTFVGRSSMEVFLTVTVEDVTKDDDPKVALTAYFTMVAINKDGRPEPVPKLAIRTPEEQVLFDEGKVRYERYKQKQRQG